MLKNRFTGVSMMRNQSVNVKKPLPNYDVIIIGGGHNGLVAAAYLAKYAGVKTCVLEKRSCLGGAAVTEEIIPGFKFSRASYLLSLLRPQIYQDLQLKKYGLEYFLRDPGSYTPLRKSLWSSKTKSLTLGLDANSNYEQISKFSKKDAKNFLVYEEKLRNLVNCMEPLMDVSPNTVFQLCNDEISLITKLKMFSSNASLRKLVKSVFMLKSSLPFAYEMMFSPALDIMNKWFESELLKATILTDACIGSVLSPASVGSSYVLLHHVMGGIEQHQGAWVYPKGGMGSISEAIARCAINYGAHLFTNKCVTEIKLNDDGKVSGVMTSDNIFIKSSIVLSNATPKITFLDLLPAEALNSNFRRRVQNINYSSPVTKINVAVGRIPNFESNPNTRTDTVMPHHRASIHLNCESVDCILKAQAEGLQGLLPKKPMIELTIPSSLDPTLCPKGNHVCLMFTQYTMYNLKNGRTWDEQTKKEYANLVFESVEEYAPGFIDSIIDYEILPPPELERIFGLTGGNIFHGELSLNQLFFNRPVNSREYSPYTPIEGLFLCGSGTHPGGGVTGSPGRLCALEIISNIKQ